MRNHIDENDKTNEIRLLFKHPSYKNKVIIIVEGYSDIRIFRSILSNDQLAFESIDGKTGLTNAMKLLSVEFPQKVLAICDADHEHLLGTSEEQKKYSIYMTDYHDIEVMMMKSKSILTFIQEFSNNINIDQLFNDLIESALTAAYPIGLLRWISYEENLNLNFKGLNFNLFCDAQKTSVIINFESLIDELIKRSKCRPEFVDNDYLMQKTSDYKSRNGCNLQVCCGHDLSNIIAIIYRQRWASLDINMDIKKVESSLRLGYQKEYFAGSNLYKNISCVLLKYGVNLR